MAYEACIENYQEGITAERSGATRLELCENLSAGGTTPSYGTVTTLIEDVRIPVRVMIRPRGGDFNYSPREFEVMKRDIELLKDTGIEGFVLGILKDSGHIDTERTRELINLSRPLKVTFHKAIDESRDLMKNLEILMELGVDSVLTSGGRESAAEGAPVICKMMEVSRGRIEVIAAGRITSHNLEEIKGIIPGASYHGKRIVGDLS